MTPPKSREEFLFTLERLATEYAKSYSITKVHHVNEDHPDYKFSYTYDYDKTKYDAARAGFSDGYEQGAASRDAEVNELKKAGCKVVEMLLAKKEVIESEFVISPEIRKAQERER